MTLSDTVSDSTSRSKWFALAAITTATLMVVLDATVINIALPQMQRELGLSDVGRGWAVTAYAITFGGLLLLGGRVADYAGRKRTLMISLVVFGLASLAGGLATTPAVLIAARALQGVAAAALAPSALSLLSATFVETRERAKAFAIYTAAGGSGGGMGLLIGGVLTDYLSWRWSMFINVVFAAIAIGIGLLTLTESRASGRRRYDVLGAILAVGATTGLVAALTLAGESGWASPTPIVLLVAALALLTAFVFWQKRGQEPLLPLHVLTDRNRAGAFLITGLAMVSMFGMFLLLPYYFQDHLGYSPLQAGLALVPFSVVLVAAALSVPRLHTWVGAKALAILGLSVATLGMGMLSQLSGSPELLGGTLPVTILLGLGLGLALTPLNNHAVSGVDPSDVGVASAVLNVAQQVGGAVGVALLNTVYVNVAGNHTGTTFSMPALQTTFIVGAAVLALTVPVAAFLLRNERIS